MKDQSDGKLISTLNKFRKNARKNISLAQLYSGLQTNQQGHTRQLLEQLKLVSKVQELAHQASKPARMHSLVGLRNRWIARGLSALKRERTLSNVKKAKALKQMYALPKYQAALALALWRKTAQLAKEAQRQ